MGDVGDAGGRATSPREGSARVGVEKPGAGHSVGAVTEGAAVPSPSLGHSSPGSLSFSGRML